MGTLITNIKTIVNVRQGLDCLRGRELADLPCIQDGFVITEDSRIAEVGKMEDLIHLHTAVTDTYDADGRFLLPAWCDSHTHLIYPYSIQNDFFNNDPQLSLKAPEEDLVLPIAKICDDTSEDDLFAAAKHRLQELIHLGTGAIGIKTGYGLSVKSELKMLRVIKRLEMSSGPLIRATFLVGSTISQAYINNRQAYLQNISHEILPVIATERLADFIEVHDDGFLMQGEIEYVCDSASKSGLRVRVITNYSRKKFIDRASTDTISTDAFIATNGDLIDEVSSCRSMNTLLPATAFISGRHLPPARKVIDSDFAVALASNYNPYSSPSGNMNIIVSLGCIQMEMLPAEVINAITFNGACAMELQDRVGSIAVGKKANFIITKPIPSLNYLPYSFGSNLIEKVMMAGEWV